MEKLIDYLKKNIKLAYKSVTFHAKQYLCFYIAIFIIQFLFSVIVMSNHNNNYQAKRDAEENYDYHIALVSLTQAQYKTLSEGYITSEQYATLVRYDMRQDTVGIVYDMYYLLENPGGDSPQSLYRSFRSDYINKIKDYSGSRYTIEPSPLYSLPDTVSDNNKDTSLWLLALGLFSVIILTLLYNIRINHFKFIYGVYMSFGADFKKLFGTSFWEMLIISVITLLPAALAATVSDFLFFAVAGYPYRFSPYLALISVLFVAPVALFAVYVPIKTVSIRSPLKLLLAEDNSNLVKSPRISFQMYGAKFPSSYERFGMWRFRKYNLTLILSAVLFSALFVCISFYSTIYDYNLRAQKEEYVINFPQRAAIYEEEEEVRKDVTLDFLTALVKGGKPAIEKYKDIEKYRFITDKGVLLPSEIENLRTDDMDKVTVYEISMETVDKVIYIGDTYTEEKKEELMQIDAVTSLYKYSKTSAYSLTSHALIPSNKTTLMSNFLLHPTVEDVIATNRIDYHSIDQEIIDYIRDYYSYEGDISKVLTEENHIVIADSYYNTTKLKLKPGDTVQIARFVKLTRTPTDPLKGDFYLEYLLKNAEFTYETYTVAAVIKNIPTGANIPFFFNHEDYEQVTVNFETGQGKKPIYNSVSIYIDATHDNEQISALTQELREWAGKYSDTSVVWNNSISETRAELAMRKIPIFISIAAMLLIISALFWFFSQIMFYRKRSNEFDLLRGMGAIESEIKKIFIYNGLTLGFIAFIVFALLSSAGVFALYKFALVILPQLSSGLKLRYVFNMPWLVAVIGSVVTFLCGFLSSYLPYVLGVRANNNKIPREFSE